MSAHRESNPPAGGQNPKSFCLAVRVPPGARRDAVVGKHGAALKVTVTAPPERGKANEAVRRLLAKEMGIRPSAVMIVRGHASRRKEVAVDAPQNVIVAFLKRFSLQEKQHE